MAYRRFRSVMAVAVALLLGGCGAPASTANGAVKPVSASPVPLTNPAAMVGLWRVAAAGEPPGTVLRIGDDLSLWRECDDFFGGWMADSHGRFVASVFTYSPNCAGARPAAPPVTWPPVITWLAEARAYRVTGTGRLLLDASGHTVARLLPGGKPIPNRYIAPQVWAPPKLDSRLVQMLREPLPLPRSLSAATTAEVIGRWVPMPDSAAGSAGHPKYSGPYIVFRGAGSWTSSDGCNIMDGRWSLGAGGSLLSVHGPTTLVGCSAPGISTMFETRRLGFAGKVLVFVSASGTELGRLIRG